MSNVGVIEKLTYFEYKDANAKDWGLNVRQRAKELVALINDPERMRAERHKVWSLTPAQHARFWLADHCLVVLNGCLAGRRAPGHAARGENACGNGAKFLRERELQVHV